jgi:hypothetical protein
MTLVQPDSDVIANIIPEEMRPIINNQLGENITGANYLTRTPAGEVRTPSGQAVVEGMDLNQIAQNFDRTVNSKLDADRFQIPQELLRNSPKSSEVTQVPNLFPVDSLTITPFPDNVNEANVFTEANQPQLDSLLARISSATSGATANLFGDADEDDNLIQIKAGDATQSGGIRAWGGNDKVLGTDVDDIVNGDAGNDQIVGARGHDLLQGGEGNDWIAGGKGDDLLLGNEGNDELFGGAGNDVIRGGSGVDVLIGNAGDDMLICDRNGGDFLMGSEGADQFILRGDTLVQNAALADRIIDFTLGEDLIKIAYFPGMDAISFAALDVNLDNSMDTAILGSNGVVGVILGIDPTQTQTQTDLTSSILMVKSQDTALSSIGEFF